MVDKWKQYINMPANKVNTVRFPAHLLTNYKVVVDDAIYWSAQHIQMKMK